MLLEPQVTGLQISIPKEAKRGDFAAEIAKIQKGIANQKEIKVPKVLIVKADVKELAVDVLMVEPKPIKDAETLQSLIVELSYEKPKLVEDRRFQWQTFDAETFDSIRFTKPIILAPMADLCPGCRAKRNQLWANPNVIAEIAKRDFVLITGNGSVEKDLEKQIKERFGKVDLPSVILNSTGMGDEPLVLKLIPEPKSVVAAIQSRFPLKEVVKNKTDKEAAIKPSKAIDEVGPIPKKDAKSDLDSNVDLFERNPVNE